MTLAQTMQRFRARLRPDSAAFFSDDDLLTAYNDGLDELSEATDFYERQVMLRLREDAAYNDLRGQIPEEALRIVSVWSPALGIWLECVTPAALDERAGREWEKVTDTPQWWWMRGLWWLGVHPKPGNATMVLKIYYCGLHPHATLTDTSFIPELPPDGEDALEEYMLYEYYAQRKETAKATERWAKYSELERSVADLKDRRQSRDRVAVVGKRR